MTNGSAEKRARSHSDAMVRMLRHLAAGTCNVTDAGRMALERVS